MSILSDKLSSNAVPCAHGLVSFNDEIKIKCPFTLFSDEFVNKVMKSINPKSKAKLFDSISFCCDEIIKFRKSIDGKEIYKNAISRIIVISSNEDNKSTITFEQLIKKLIKSKIIVDCIILSSANDEQFNTLCAISHITGGLSFNPKKISEIINILENNAFLNYEERFRKEETTVLSQITKQILNEIIKKEKIDLEIQNKIVKKALIIDDLITPRYFLKKNQNKAFSNIRINRIMKELQEASDASDPNSPSYDPDIVIYPYKSRVDEWKVFLNAPEYEKETSCFWVQLYVSFPELYPYQPPIIRFISIPYHINVSKDGRFCMNILEGAYKSTIHVVDYYLRIKIQYIAMKYINNINFVMKNIKT